MRSEKERKRQRHWFGVNIFVMLCTTRTNIFSSGGGMRRRWGRSSSWAVAWPGTMSRRREWSSVGCSSNWPSSWSKEHCHRLQQCAAEHQSSDNWHCLTLSVLYCYSLSVPTVLCFQPLKINSSWYFSCSPNFLNIYRFLHNIANKIFAFRRGSIITNNLYKQFICLVKVIPKSMDSPSKSKLIK